ncbi:interferon-induced protein with tetratricopeptide repeats 5-like [Tachyglossus aculeatus]|uniref:interferon-induced protein with tetratricopeptide repeats 5-like n=1 Tax=Tachyglossus aculeatus TaxID=9261 RepID=UPI0018F47FCA|nr:interferon-induced protein with tetratricopeptide repeats 5-like [Tachyglossus aculeatus]
MCRLAPWVLILNFENVTIHSNVSKDSLRTRLLQLECHFTWDLLKEDITLQDLEERVCNQIQFLTTKSKATSYNLLAYTRYLQGHNEEALESLGKAEKEIQGEDASGAEVRSVVTWSNLAWMSYHMDLLADAQAYADRVERACQALSSRFPYKAEWPEILTEEGWASLTFGGKYYERAKACFEKALKQEPNNPEFNSGFAIAIYRLENIASGNFPADAPSLHALRRAVRLNPDDTPVQVFLGLRLQDVNREAEGEKYIQEALEQMSSVPYVLRYAAKFYRRKGTLEKSLQLLEEAARFTPNSGFVHHQKGLCYRARINKIKKATNYQLRGRDNEDLKELISLATIQFEKFVEKKPKFVFAYIDLANMYAEGDDYDKAEVNFQKALHLERLTDGEKQQIHLNYGRFQEFHRKSQAGALHHYLEGLKIKRESEEREKLKGALRRLVSRRLRCNPADAESLGLLRSLGQLSRGGD